MIAGEVGGLLADKLRQLDGVLEVRGKGLMLGLTFEYPIARRLEVKCLEQGVIVNALDERTIRLLPPLVITKTK